MNMEISTESSLEDGYSTQGTGCLFHCLTFYIATDLFIFINSLIKAISTDFLPLENLTHFLHSH